jgi:hypothetical protein
MTKLCKDCKWYRKDWFSHIFSGTNQFDTCGSPYLTNDFVTGSEERSCAMMRSDQLYSCGPDGRFWEAK